MKNKKHLIIAPHPDDEILGCGGIIAKYTQRNDFVYVLVLTRGIPSLFSDESVENVRKECLEAHKLLGVTKTIFLDFPAPALDSVPIYEISNQIAKVITEIRPENLFLPHRGDIHNDHYVTFKAGLVAARPVNNNSVKNIYCYETLSETEWAAPFADDAFIPNVFENIEGAFIESKCKAMEKFASQLRPFPSSRSLKTIRSLAAFRGSTVGFTCAEAFMLIRSIV